MEDELTQAPLESILNQIADPTPTPGGGAALAIAGSLAASLTDMVARMTTARRKYRDVWGEIEPHLARLEEIRRELGYKISEDAVVYKQVILLLSLQNEKNNETAVRSIEDALTASAQVPLSVAEYSAEAGEIAFRLVEIGHTHAVADAAAAVYLAYAAVCASAINVRTNLADVTNEKLKTSWINRSTRAAHKMNELITQLPALVAKRLEAGDPQPESGRRRRRRS